MARPIRPLSGPAFGRPLLHLDDSVGLREGQGAKQYGVDNAENRRVGANAEGQNQYCPGGEAAILGEHPHTVTKSCQNASMDAHAHISLLRSCAEVTLPNRS